MLDLFVSGRLPLSRFEWVLVTSWTYLFLAIMAQRQFVVRAKDAKSLPSGKSWTLFVHNLLLSLASLVMFLGLVRTSCRRSNIEGMDWLVCEPLNSNSSDSIIFWSYLYYLSKYYELGDTILAFVCRGKGPRHFYMHVYHHFYVLYMSYFYVASRQSLATVGMLFNTFVHIFMYYYYARAALQLETSWKNWVTRLQIIQFLFSFLLASIAVFIRPSWSLFSNECAGAYPLAANCLFNFTLLLLFFNVLKSSKKMKK
uniref:Elongation of fatty acids protein n=1 Tax=Aureoumbra lagunensis TaxID=44058 RepID=A0A7S3NP17_9STRA|mmetsp:Transcript_3458/g.4840  ORF Transcript_3458/g.4840 Transcript_3458/m.4840 type:complete len:256 (+) Transcript_3458:48-815(+)